MLLRCHILGLLLLVGLLVSAPANAGEYVLLIHPPSSESVDRDMALSLIRGERRNWQGGIGARVVLPSRNSDHYEPLAEQLFGLSGSGMERQWFRMVFAGQVDPPVYLDSDAEVRLYVAAHPGALGVVMKQDQGEPLPDSVRAIPF